MSPVYVSQLTPLVFLERAAKTFPNKTAMVLDGQRSTYLEMADHAQRVAAGLRDLGIGPGDRVAYLAPNVPELLVAHFAVPLSTGVLVALNTRLSPPEIAYILRHCGADVLIVHHTLLESVQPIVGELTLGSVVVIGQGTLDGIATTSYDRLRATEVVAESAWTVDDELATVSINYTSGTTGKPKGVMYTHRGAYLNALGELIHSRHTVDSVYLWTLPMFHCNGWCTPWALTAIGGTHVCLDAIDVEKIWSLFETESITHFNAAPTVLTMLANSPSAHTLARTVVATTAGAPPSPTTIRQSEEFGFEIVHVYGLTETYGPYSICESQPEWRDLDAGALAKLRARQGVGMIQTDGLRVVLADMTDVPADGVTIGEIVMRGNNVMKGYFDDPDATADAFRSGWFHSGDLGVMHPDGYIELRDRSKDIIISGGENISSVEIEQALVSHSAVLEAAVVAVVSEKWGERPKAYVVLKNSAHADEFELRAHVAGQLAKFKVPDAIDIVDALPKTSTGKIQKFRLRNAVSVVGSDV